MGIYDELQGIAGELLTEFKQGIISYIRMNSGNGPIDNPGVGVPDTFTFVGATASGVSKKYVDSGVAVATDLQVVAPVDTRFTPNMKDRIEIDGVSMKILQIDQKPAAGTPVAFIYVVGKGPG